MYCNVKKTGTTQFHHVTYVIITLEMIGMILEEEVRLLLHIRVHCSVKSHQSNS